MNGEAGKVGAKSGSESGGAAGPGCVGGTHGVGIGVGIRSGLCVCADQECIKDACACVWNEITVC